MEQIIAIILLAIFGISVVFLVSMLLIMALVNKSLFCAIVYSFIFEHNDWLLYKKAKKQGIQHYLNGYHFSQFYKEWNRIENEYGVDNILAADYLDKETTDVLHAKYIELAEKYHYKEYNDVDKSINDDDIVLSLNMYSENLYIGVGDRDKNLLIWKSMVKDILRGYEIWANGKTDNIKHLLINPKEVVSF